jgi:hypothetical protein
MNLRRILSACLILSGSVLLMGSDTPDVGFDEFQKQGFDNQLGMIGGLGVSGWDTISVVFTPDSALDHAFSAYDSAVANADFVYELGTDVDYAYATLNQANENGVGSVNGAAVYADTDQSWDLVEADKDFNILYVDFASVLPYNVQVIESNMYVNSVSYFISSNDTIFATLMQDESDNVWMTSRGITDGSGSRPNYAHASWDYQIQGSNGEGADEATLISLGFPATSSGAWDWSVRNRIEDVGSVFDFTGNRTGVEAWPAPSNINIKNCVQAAVTGQTNNGIMFGFKETQSTYQLLYTIWERTGSFDTYKPWIEVKYITRKYTPTYPGGKDWAFVFCTDAALGPANTVYRDSMNARGWDYTIFLGGNEYGGAGHMTAADLIAARAEGHEIGCMGLFHEDLTSYDAEGMVINTYSRGDDWADLTGASTGYDTLLTTTSPKWLHDAMGGYWDDLYVGKSFAMGFSKWNPEILQAMNYHYYRSYRVGNYSPSTYKLPQANCYARVARATERPAKTDSIWGQINPLIASMPQNLCGFSLNPQLVHGSANPVITEIDEDDLRQNIRHAINKVRATNGGYWLLFSHGLRDGDGYGAAGITAFEFGVILEEVAAANGAVMTFGEHARYLQSKATAIATPASYAQPDSFKFDVGDSVWFRLDAVDSTFVPGVPAN